MPLIEARSLVKEFGSISALAGIDLEVREGEIFGVVGPPGSGKTTLLELIATAIAPTRGTLRVGGLDVVEDRREIRRFTGVAPQEIALRHELTAAENLELFGAMYGLGGTRLRRRARELLAEFGLDPRSRERVRALDADRCRRVHVAGALLHTPRLVLLDEPVGGAGHETAADLSRIIASLPESGSTVLLATRRAGLAERLCKRVAILADGALLAAGTQADLGRGLAHRAVVRIRAREELRAQVVDDLVGRRGYALEPHVLELRARDGDEAGSLLAEAAASLDHAGLHLLSAEVREPDLRSIVYELTGYTLES